LNKLAKNNMYTIVFQKNNPFIFYVSGPWKYWGESRYDAFQEDGMEEIYNPFHSIMAAENFYEDFLCRNFINNLV